MNLGLMAKTKAVLPSCHQKILSSGLETTSSRWEGRSQTYKEKEQLPIGMHHALSTKVGHYFKRFVSRSSLSGIAELPQQFDLACLCFAMFHTELPFVMIR